MEFVACQFGRESAKENKSTSGQSTDGLYDSKWIFIDKMRFVEKVKKATRRSSTTQVTRHQFDDSDLDAEIEQRGIGEGTPVVKPSERNELF